LLVVCIFSSLSRSFYNLILICSLELFSPVLGVKVTHEYVFISQRSESRHSRDAFAGKL